MASRKRWVEHSETSQIGAVGAQPREDTGIDDARFLFGMSVAQQQKPAPAIRAGQRTVVASAQHTTSRHIDRPLMTLCDGSAAVNRFSCRLRPHRRILVRIYLWPDL